MLLRQKKVQGEDQNWCVILSPIPSALDKKRVAERISHVFSLSPDEASDLVANTPIIILDNLNRGIAGKLKDFFRAAGAETILTNDTFQKRKCYRTVWPEPPNLSFLQSWNPLVEKTQDHSEELGPEEALDEIRTLTPPPPPAPAPVKKETPKPSAPAGPIFQNRPEKNPLAEEAERWRKECMKLREESQELKRRLERMEKDNTPAQFRDDKKWLEEKEKEMKQAQVLLEHANEKYEVLRQEYSNARHLYEEKISALLQETERSKKKITELTENLSGAQRQKLELESQTVEGKKSKAASEERLTTLAQAFEQSKRTAAELTENLQKSLQEKQTLDHNYSQKSREYQVAIEDLRQTKNMLEEKLSSTTQVLEQFKRQAAEQAEILRSTQSQKQTVEVALTQARQEIQKLQDEIQKGRLAYEQKIFKHTEDAARLELNLKNMTEKMTLLQKTKEQLELTVNTQSEQIAYWHDKHSKVLPQFEEVSKKLQDEKQLRELAESRSKDMEKTQYQIMQDAQQKSLRSNELEQKLAQIEERYNQLQEIYQSQEKMLENHLKVLETRDRELEAARRQIRDVNAQIEQREMIQKRNQLTQLVAEKEALLKRIVQDQHKIEAEMKEREAAIRTILIQQEAVEKEIVDAKQAQRHMAELAKRDQHKGRIKPGAGAGNYHLEAPAESDETGDR